MQTPKYPFTVRVTHEEYLLIQKYQRGSLASFVYQEILVPWFEQKRKEEREHARRKGATASLSDAATGESL